MITHSVAAVKGGCVDVEHGTCMFLFPIPLGVMIMSLDFFESGATCRLYTKDEA